MKIGLIYPCEFNLPKGACHEELEKQVLSANGIAVAIDCTSALKSQTVSMIYVLP